MLIKDIFISLSVIVIFFIGLFVGTDIGKKQAMRTRGRIVQYSYELTVKNNRVDTVWVYMNIDKDQ